MAKNSVMFVCTHCGWDSAKWFGRCPSCSQWGTITEFVPSRTDFIQQSNPASQDFGKQTSKQAGTQTPSPLGQAGQQPGNSATSAPLQSASYHDPASRVSGRSGRSGKTHIANLDPRNPALAQPITHISAEQGERISTGIAEFDRVLGSGIVLGSVCLVAGEPGIGKSTLLLQTAGTVAQEHPEHTVLYISGEESATQVKLRASRILCLQDNMLLASTTDLSTTLALIERHRPILTIVDSAQTMISADVEGTTGGSTQVREVATSLIDVAKTFNLPIMLVGHVTKDGNIAGPRTLEHLVDVVCQFEGQEESGLRFLRCSKNRFGPTDEVGCFSMCATGIEEVQDPAELFISRHRQPVAGTCITINTEGIRSLPIEVQALVTQSALPTPRRAVNGIDHNRLAMLIAVLYRHGSLNMLGQDVYASTIAGAAAKEPSCDLAIALALASAMKNKPLPEGTCAIGEISLAGRIHEAGSMHQRLKEVQRLGFKTLIIPEDPQRHGTPAAGGQQGRQQQRQQNHQSRASSARVALIDALRADGVTCYEVSSLRQALSMLSLIE